MLACRSCEGVCNPSSAYILQSCEFLVTAGVQDDLPEAVARSLMIQTSIGSDVLAKDQPHESLRSMIRNICVPTVWW
jgi:pyrroline-5-carboxylate reductase